MTSRLAGRLAAAVACTALAGLVVVGAPAGAGASGMGIFIWTGPSGDTPIPFPANECYATPGATGAQNFTSGDAFYFLDTNCTIGEEAGSTGPFASFATAFESVKIRSAGDPS